jgi:prepilin-type N-terminal cleavage/methylation domain-containing protein/prepilin-type processing-associated H-X9-DG protein
VNDRPDQFATTQPIKKSPRAFTLVELLVVIAIVGVLAALIIPAVKSGLSSAKSVQSVSHLKQIGGLVGIYAAENNNQLPYAAVWEKIFGGSLVYFSRSLSQATIPGFKYAKSPQSDARPLPKIFYDPVLESNPRPAHAMGAFGVNTTIIPGVWSEAERPTSLNGISRASQKVIMGSMNSKTGSMSGGWSFSGEDFVNQGTDAPDYLDPRHGGKAACLFADGHVEKMDVKNMDQATRRRHFTLDP